MASWSRFPSNVIVTQLISHVLMKISLALLACLAPGGALAYVPERQALANDLSRRDAFSRGLSVAGSAFTTAALLTASSPSPSLAFDGSGSSAYSGKNPQSVLERRKTYQARVVQDAKDFVRLGAAIARGETDGDAWVFVFSPFERREPDAAGRTFAAVPDLIGHVEGRELVGGCGYLLASSFTKQGKPPETTPAVKSFTALSKTFDAIKEAGSKGKADKAKAAYDKAAPLFAKYLEDVGLPGDLSDPIYR